MFRRFLLSLLVGAICFGGVACEKKKSLAELQAEKVRTFRAKQRQLAITKYQEIVTKYPDSEFAARAQERLNELGPATPPKKK